MNQHLGGRLGIRQRAMTGPGGDAEEVRQRGEANAANTALEQATGQRCGAERRFGQAASVDEEQLPLEEALVEARVVRDEQVVAGEVEEAAQDGRDRGRVPQLLLAQAGEAGDRLGQWRPWVDERLERVDQLQRPHAHRPQLADQAARGREPGGLEVEDDELGVLQQRVRPALGERDGGAVAHEPAVAGGGLEEQRTGETGRDRGRREQAPRGLDGRQRATLLERVHQPVERVERKLHLTDESEHMFAAQAPA